ncbi:MAG: type III pantothenate kinase, partial [Flavobacteriales bacterium]|nr:type III pantothenate kinase [Flavobacteriales bacterium]
MDLVIDAGNTKVKIGVCDNDTIINTLVIRYADIADTLKIFCKNNTVNSVLVCSVGPVVAWDRLILCKKMLKLSINTPLGISNTDVLSSETGVDRLATIGGTALAYPNEKVLVIDAGTCITYDFVDENGAYTCGNISPGLQLRLNAMHQFTSALPQLAYSEPQGDTSIERYTTTTCMTGGAIDGI